MSIKAEEFKVVEYAVSSGIATVTLNRPHRMNAWTGRMHAEYRSAIALAEDDADVRAIVITGSGQGFCVGGDSKALEGHVEKGGYDPGTPENIAEPGYGIRPEFDAPFSYHFGLTKPVIAAINGPAAGVGLALACFADIRFARKAVKLTTAHGKLNLPAEFGLSWILPRLVGLTRANDILLTSRVVMSEEAQMIGLVNDIYDGDELMPATYSYARKMIETVSPGSLLETKKQIYTDLHQSAAASVQDSELLIRKMMQQPDYREGIRAFVEKRKPQWHLPEK